MAIFLYHRYLYNDRTLQIGFIFARSTISSIHASVNQDEQKTKTYCNSESKLFVFHNSIKLWDATLKRVVL
jgi:hypothetical protein